MRKWGGCQRGLEEPSDHSANMTKCAREGRKGRSALVSCVVYCSFAEVIRESWSQRTMSSNIGPVLESMLRSVIGWK